MAHCTLNTSCQYTCIAVASSQEKLTWFTLNSILTGWLAKLSASCKGFSIAMATTEVAILGQTSGFTLNNMKMIQHWLIQWLYALLVIQSTCVYSQDYGYDSKQFTVH